MSRYGWRDRLALWCLRILTPKGIVTDDAPIWLDFDPGLSTPENPKLVCRIRSTVRYTNQTIISLVFEPDTVVTTFQEQVDHLREWADANRGAS